MLSWFSKKSGLFDFIRGLSIRSILAFLFHELRKREYSRPTILLISVRQRLLIIQEIIRTGSLTLFLAYSARSHSLYSLASETSHDYLASSLFQCQSDVNFMLRSFFEPSSLISLPRRTGYLIITFSHQTTSARTASSTARWKEYWRIPLPISEPQQLLIPFFGRAIAPVLPTDLGKDLIPPQRIMRESSLTSY